jgi:hypothetical protein
MSKDEVETDALIPVKPSESFKDLAQRAIQWAQAVLRSEIKELRIAKRQLGYPAWLKNYAGVWFDFRGSYPKNT